MMIDDKQANFETSISHLRQNQSMSMLTTLQLTPKHSNLHKTKPLTTTIPSCNTHFINNFPFICNTKIAKSAALIGTGLAITALVGPATAGELALIEPSNALSLPTWAIHVSSVAEWSCFFLILLFFDCVCVFVSLLMFCL